MRLRAFCCALPLLCGGALAQDAALPPEPAQFASLFQSYCLDKFPDDSRLDAAAADARLRPLSPDEVRLFLRGDPGHGWAIESGNGRFMLTDEDPPFHACSIRHAAKALFGVEPIHQAIERYVAAKGHRLVEGQSLRMPLGAGIVSTLSSQTEMTEGGIPTGETFMLAVVSYPALAQQDGSKSEPFWEIRFVRQIVRNPV